ncbi:C-type natriuretic peptide 2 [Pseudoliparis swirei]|uniref:C-type natriuretic peptide 2 n=1 Tax=Pseudoliparis swirei TaxID=2059687 RepID=UPI0024BDADF2|nr:C-type natriuretic peptide 2 [Pseudoliparis swirei]
MAVSSSSSFLPLLLLFLTVAVESRPSRQQHDPQVLGSLFGSRLCSLILAPPTSDDITEGSAGGPASSSSAPSGRFLLNLLRQQSKTRRWSRKSMVGGGRGCFGMKMDRIGSISGLGC